MEQYSRFNANANTNLQDKQLKETTLEQKLVAFNFDMNEEFSPSLMAMIPQQDPSNTNKKKKKIKKPERLPIEITHYNRAAINFIFILVFFTTVLLNIDNGAIAAATIEIKDSKDIDNFQLGGLQSLVFVGILLGTFRYTIVQLFFIGQALSPVIFRKILEKLIIAVSLTLCIISLIIFVLSQHFFLSCFSRLINGFFQAYIQMYYLAWMDAFGIPLQKQTWLSVIMLSPFFSYFFGYILTALLVSNGFKWQIVFYFQCGLLIPCVIFSLITPEKYFDIDSAVELKKQQEEQNRQGTFRSSMTEDQLKKDEWNIYQSYGQPAVIIAGNLEKKMRRKLYDMDINVTQQQKLEEELIQSAPPSQYIYASKIMKNRSFIFFTLSLTGYYYIISGLQLFFTDYAQNVVHANKESLYVYFTIFGSIAPTLGCMLGAYITTKVGGSSSPQSLGVLCLASFFSTVVALPIPFLTQFGSLMFMTTLLLFFIGFIIPILAGQLLFTVYQGQRVVANSIASLSFIILGFLPAPTIYGMISKVVNQENSRYPMGTLIYSTILSSTFLFIALISKLKYKRSESQPKQQRIRTALYADPEISKQYYPVDQKRNTVQEELKSGESLNHQQSDYIVDAQGEDTVRGRPSLAQIYTVDTARAVQGGDHDQRPLNEQLISPSNNTMKQMIERRAEKSQKRMQLNNINRLKYDSVHLLIGRTFIPTSLGIVNEDFYM